MELSHNAHKPFLGSAIGDSLYPPSSSIGLADVKFIKLGKIDDHILDTTLQIPKGIKYLRGYYLARLSTSWPEIWSDLWD